MENLITGCARVRRLSRTIIGLVIFAFVLPLVATGQSNTQLKPDTGSFNRDTYTNEYFGFTYKLSEDWYINQELMAQDGQRPNKLAGRFLLMILDRHTGKPTRERVMMMADDASLYHPPLNGAKDYVTKLVNAQVKGQGMEPVRDVFFVEYGGNTFYRGEFNERYPGGVLHKAFVALERGGFLLSWTFVASSAEELDSLVKSLNQVSFAPIVPGVQKPAESEASALPPKRIRISQMALQAFILEKPLPPYPEEARKNKIQGLVRLHVLISRTGELKNAEVLEGDPSLRQAALDGIRYWRYKPYLLNGEPVEVDSQITIIFVLPKKPS